MKILFTVLCAEWLQHPLLADGIRETWGKDNPDVYYLWGNNHKNIQPGDWVWWRPEGYGAMLWKFLDFLTEHSSEDFDYVMKTNTGAYVDIPALYRFLEPLPRHSLYCGAIGHYKNEPYNTVNMTYVSGAGTIISRDLVDLMIGDDRKDFGFEHIDDVAVGQWMQAHGITPTKGQRAIELQEKSYHYYLRSHDGEREKDIEKMHILHEQRKTTDSRRVV
jgi:hypothetical protein